MTEIDPDAVRKLLELELPPDNDAGAPTARGWLAELLKVAWKGGEDAFKRPFGFSGPWTNELREQMVLAGLIDGEFDEDDELAQFDGERADALILAAIDAMGHADEDETPGYWFVRAALAAAVHALQLVKLGSDVKLAAMATETLAKVDETMRGEPADGLTKMSDVDVAAEFLRLRERLRMLLADTPFEFRPDWASEYIGDGE